MPGDPALERLTPQAAVDAAAWQVGGPVLVLMLGPTLGVLFIGAASGASAGGLFMAAGMVLIPSWLIAWLAWSILTPRWRLWAYARVDDLDELKRVALADRVIWPEGHIIHRGEWAPASLRARLATIEAERRARQAAAPSPAKPRAAKTTTAKPRKPKTPAS